MRLRCALFSPFAEKKLNRRKMYCIMTKHAREDKTLDDLEYLVESIAPEAKACGYKKVRRTWCKEKEGLTVVLSIQKSQFDAEAWYCTYGVCLHQIAKGSTHTLGACQIRYRVDCAANGTALGAEQIVSLLEKWETMYGDIQLLRRCAVQGKLPIHSSAEAVRYLTTVDLSKI